MHIQIACLLLLDTLTIVTTAWDLTQVAALQITHEERLSCASHKEPVYVAFAHTLWNGSSEEKH
jgi:hypothetical protein